MVDGLAIDGEPRGVVWHQALPLSGTNWNEGSCHQIPIARPTTCMLTFAAEVRLSALAEFAFATLCRIFIIEIIHG